ncbi:uncharacterized protein APUU_61118S [Aspergillus puulaauensis]|uniref:Uncharacterized protein n=1 Tax=Aspergillus puulaauensis TaxID=1220207 RepID=A0A7R7XUR4_9EURO|nr:uncharacterized protein APUU_61118S [Aspergillus puulaauensis]BCS28070.1 hypothetical protein APUU_61118S [Aspergillus puulaauensis]
MQDMASTPHGSSRLRSISAISFADQLPDRIGRQAINLLQPNTTSCKGGWKEDGDFLATAWKPQNGHISAVQDVALCWTKSDNGNHCRPDLKLSDQIRSH